MLQLGLQDCLVEELPHRSISTLQQARQLPLGHTDSHPLLVLLLLVMLGNGIRRSC